MTPIATCDTNTILGAPKGKPGVGQLPISRDLDNEIMYSFWQPDESDIANILAGLPVRLAIMGTGHPPVQLSVTDKV